MMLKKKETLEGLQKSMEKICKEREFKPYEKERFKEGWMYIGKDSYQPYYKLNFKPRSDLAEAAYDSLEDGITHEFVFDENRGLWKKKNLVSDLREICRKMDPTTQEILKKFDGKYLMLDRMSDADEEDDWTLDSESISWFLRRPKKWI